MSDKRTKWWYRLLQVIFVLLIFFGVFLSLGGAATYYYENQVVDLDKSSLLCTQENSPNPIYLSSIQNFQEEATNYSRFSFEETHKNILKIQCLNDIQQANVESIIQYGEENDTTEEETYGAILAYVTSVEDNYQIQLETKYSGDIFTLALITLGVFLSSIIFLLTVRSIFLYVLFGNFGLSGFLKYFISRK